MNHQSWSSEHAFRPDLVDVGWHVESEMFRDEVEEERTGYQCQRPTGRCRAWRYGQPISLEELAQALAEARR
jgi:hypothetical protein